MARKVRTRCFLIGEGTLLIQCAEILVKERHKILGIISSRRAIVEWSNKRKIPCIQPTDNWLELLSQEPFEYLFSIFNNRILSKEVLKLPRQCTINYHDAPLPKYAGVNATSWALIRGEREHGVSWHIVSAVVDAGDILKQTLVKIEPNETSFTLNAKCYEAAIASFRELITDISAQRLNKSQQNLAHRTYFGRSERLSAGGLIDFNSQARKLDALVRAMDFRSYINPLGTVKLAIGSDLITVAKLSVLDEASIALPGTITAIKSDFLQVATNDFEVALQHLKTLDGQILSTNELASKFKLKVGDRFQLYAPEIIDRIEQVDSAIAKYEEFWVERLTDLQPLSLPYASRNCHGQPPQFKKIVLVLPQKAIDFSKQRFGEEYLAEFWLAVWGMYLTRLSGKTCFDVALSYGELQRELVDLESFFAAQVPIRFEIDSQQSSDLAFSNVLAHLHLTRKHKSYARDIVLRYPQLKSRFEYQAQNLPISFKIVDDHCDLDGCLGSELTFAIIKGDRQSYWFYDTTVLDSECIAKMQSQFLTFIEDLITNSDQPLAKLNLLSPPEKQQILVTWNNSQADYKYDFCLHQLFEERVVQTPEAVAIRCGNLEITYQELNSRADHLAAYLQELGVEPETLVGIFTEYSIETIVGLLGILKAGGAYVPLDPKYPPERLAHMIEDAKVSVLLTQQKLIAKLPPHQAEVVCLDIDQNKKKNFTTTKLVKPSNLAYVIYTSGSTGKPKGVAIAHYSVVNTIIDINQRFKINQEDRVLCLSSLSFDLSVYDIFGLLGAGGTLVIPPTANEIDPAGWFRAIAQEKVTIWNSAPAVMEVFVNYLLDRDEKFPDSLNLVLLSGDRISVNLPVQLKTWNEKLQVISLGGATEASIWSIIYPLKHCNSEWTSIPYGRPLSNQSFYILDAERQPVPISIPGELYIGGIGVARGYLNRPELSAERFIDNPFGDAQASSRLPMGDRLYKTGDLGRYLSDGNIEFLGRLDDQVKIRGFRVELGEIETLLLQHPDVREVAVIAREDIPGNKRLVAYLIPATTVAPSRFGLRTYLKDQLPDYSIPSVFVVLDTLPLTPNGKLDRRALPAPELSRSEARQETSFVPPRNDLELHLVNIWQKLLGVAQIGITDNFFELGGNSLLAVRLFSQIERQFGKNLPLATLFHAPSITELVEIIKQKECSPSWSSLVAIQTGGSKPPLFCIHALGGNVLSYRYLASCLGTEQPVYGLQVRGLDGENILYTRIEDMAAHYLQEIISLQPEEPYFLSGHSFGGLVAFEIAQQLYRQDRQVAFLGLFDCLISQYISKSDFATWVKAHLTNLSALGLKAKLDYIWMVVQFKIERKIPSAIALSTNKLANLFRSPPEILKSQIKAANEIAFNNYIPTVYPGKVTLFLPKIKQVKSYIDPNGGWSQLALGGVETCDVPGDHASILIKDSDVRILAKVLQECLERV
jgi:amino acid adenylation domain-containing protein